MIYLRKMYHKYIDFFFKYVMPPTSKSDDSNQYRKHNQQPIAKFT